MTPEEKARVEIDAMVIGVRLGAVTLTFMQWITSSEKGATAGALEERLWVAAEQNKNSSWT